MSKVANLIIDATKRIKAEALLLDRCALLNIPEEVGELVWLKSLSLRDNLVTDLAPLAGLSFLERLDVSSTSVGDLTPLAGLFSLVALDVSSTRVTDPSPLISLIRRGLQVIYGKGQSLASRKDPFPSAGPPRDYSGFYVGNCPLVNPPPEIVQQGNDAILNYFREREAGGVDHLYEAKMLILGEGGAGKTSLLRRLFQPDKPLPREDETTKGIAIFRHEFNLRNGRRFRLNVWDFGGQQIYHATHQFFLTHRSLYVLASG